MASRPDSGRRGSLRERRRPSGRSGRWLLLRRHSPLASHRRCFGRGDVLTEEGVLLASFAQESLLRFV
ncbi:hypothetical protein [Streptomyces sp. NPDC005423]|uniref:hypothetical protein n=1 Tax=Streptomyces sp. NPDC005423 TaxID=3155343 RepID=UPI0033A684FA